MEKVDRRLHARPVNRFPVLVLVALLAVPPGTASAFEVPRFAEAMRIVWLVDLDGPGPGWNDVFEQAAHGWDRWTTPPFSFSLDFEHEMRLRPCSNNSVTWDDQWPGEVCGGKRGPFASISGSGIVLSYAGRWNPRDITLPDVDASDYSGSMMTHEIGHNLGLEHSSAGNTEGGIVMATGGGKCPVGGGPKLPGVDDICGLAVIQGTLVEDCPLLLPGVGRSVSGLPTTARFAAGVTSDAGASYTQRGRVQTVDYNALPTIHASFVVDRRHVDDRSPVHLHVVAEVVEKDGEVFYYAVKDGGAEYEIGSGWSWTEPYSGWTSRADKLMVSLDPDRPFPLPVAERHRNASLAHDVAWEGDMREVHFMRRLGQETKDNPWPEWLTVRFWLAYSIEPPRGRLSRDYPEYFFHPTPVEVEWGDACGWGCEPPVHPISNANLEPPSGRLSRAYPEY